MPGCDEPSNTRREPLTAINHPSVECTLITPVSSTIRTRFVNHRCSCRLSHRYMLVWLSTTTVSPTFISHVCRSHNPLQGRTKRRQAGSRAAGFDLRAEAYVDWPCVRCTFINTYDREACEGCGGANVKRDKLLRERRREVERLGRLQSARECRDRSVVCCLGV